MDQLELVVDWLDTCSVVVGRIESSQQLLLACSGVAAYCQSFWIPLSVALCGICGALATFFSTDSTATRVLSLVVAVASVCPAVVTAAASRQLAAGLAQRTQDIEQLEKCEELAEALAAELQGLGLLRSQQLVAASKGTVQHTLLQARLALARARRPGRLPTVPAP